MDFNVVIDNILKDEVIRNRLDVIYSLFPITTELKDHSVNMSYSLPGLGEGTLALLTCIAFTNTADPKCSEYFQEISQVWASSYFIKSLSIQRQRGFSYLSQLVKEGDN